MLILSSCISSETNVPTDRVNVASRDDLVALRILIFGKFTSFFENEINQLVPYMHATINVRFRYSRKPFIKETFAHSFLLPSYLSAPFIFRNKKNIILIQHFVFRPHILAPARIEYVLWIIAVRISR